MMDRVVVLTGSSFRHKYFAVRLWQELQSVIGIIVQELPSFKSFKKENVSPFVESHVKQFEETERGYFEEIVEYQYLGIRKLVKLISDEALNTPANVDYIRSLKPQIIAVYGTFLIGKEIIDICPDRILNLHAGLSPYYRGSATNVWPFYNRELEYIGMTVHKIDSGIDSGEIIHQARPAFAPDDNTHTIGCKCVIIGVDLMLKTIKELQDKGGFTAYKQDKKIGRLYTKKEMTEDVLKEIYRLIDNGLVRNYEAKEVRIIP